MAGAGAGPHPAARTTPPPHFKVKIKKNGRHGRRKARLARDAKGHATSQVPNNAAREKRGPPRNTWRRISRLAKSAPQEIQKR